MHYVLEIIGLRFYYDCSERNILKAKKIRHCNSTGTRYLMFTFVVRITLSFNCVHCVIRNPKSLFIQRITSFLAAQYQSYQRYEIYYGMSFDNSNIHTLKTFYYWNTSAVIWKLSKSNTDFTKKMKLYASNAGKHVRTEVLVGKLHY